jgi:hypothetical protein
VQALKPDEKPHHFQFAKDILSNIKANENYLQTWIFSAGNNCRIWGSENPHAIQEIKRDSADVNV